MAEIIAPGAPLTLINSPVVWGPAIPSNSVLPDDDNQIILAYESTQQLVYSAADQYYLVLAIYLVKPGDYRLKYTYLPTYQYMWTKILANGVKVVEEQSGYENRMHITLNLMNLPGCSKIEIYAKPQYTDHQYLIGPVKLLAKWAGHATWVFYNLEPGSTTYSFSDQYHTYNHDFAKRQLPPMREIKTGAHGGKDYVFSEKSW